ncbi:hypothetical protein QTH97_33565 [Variovorax sp. J22R24]|uniref:hypothetical protein n=1 Tax=Variovorax gracilis TaxID=3053502 RepID=UPI002578D284|nr:hypothetical protein [Variovorax sp. J22R24]MDM0109882.1 hypothetical protein [Variovorax sp. J22R24]
MSLKPSVGLIAALATGFAMSAAAGVFDAPIPDDAFVMEPSPPVPADFKPISGKWVGTLIGSQMQQEHAIIVERMVPGLAWVVWSIGTGRGQMAGGPSLWYRVPGRLINGNLVLFINGAVATYTPQADGTMKVVSERGGFKMKGTLERQLIPTQPFTNDEPPTYWPPDITRMQPGPSKNPTPAAFQEPLPIEPASPMLPADRAKWLGKWSGWACAWQACDVKLAVLQATRDTARVIHLFISKTYQPDYTVRDGRFVDDELRLRFGDGYRVTYRMRATGVVEAFYVDPSGSMAWGVMTKEP